MTHAHDPETDTARLDPVGSAGADGAHADAGYSYPDGALDVFDDDPFADDLSKELEARAPRPKATRTTLVLGGVVLVVAGFLGGVLVQKNYGTTAAAGRGSAVPGAFASAFANGGQANGGQGTGANGRGGNATTGTVKFVDGTTIYLTDANGDTVTVKTSGTTTVTSQSTTAVKDLKVGATVTVQGTADSDGVITATRVIATK